MTPLHGLGIVVAAAVLAAAGLPGAAAEYEADACRWMVVLKGYCDPSAPAPDRAEIDAFLRHGTREAYLALEPITEFDSTAFRPGVLADGRCSDPAGEGR